MIKISVGIAQRVLMAYKGQSVSYDECQNVFVSFTGQIIHCYNAFNFRKIGHFISEKEFIVKGVKYKLE